MDEIEAKMYLPISSLEELEDIYDDELFKLKQFFLTRVPSTKLLQIKKSKMDKLSNAYSFFGGEENISWDMPELVSFSNLSVLGAFSAYQENVTRIKMKIASVLCIRELIEIEKLHIVNLNNYASLFPVIKTVSSTVVSQEPDQMLFLEEIKKNSLVEELQFREIPKLDVKNLIYKEAIRLSLWLKMESDAR